MSIFEIGMLLCFGAAWPFSIYKSLRYKEVRGKSLPFLIIVLTGYIAGILHKIFYNYDAVVYLYMLNGLMVTVDIVLYLRYRNRYLIGRE
ncbi:MAG: hypothetical protein M1610_00285 [Nitrospirae bacterium]|nr:hypothetical protein [Nitrospirota bacterium]MDA8340529.1 hypothetical protein [Nitrospiraceae bacterium]